MADADTPQLWIRTESGRVLGPLGPATLAILAEDGAFGARCEASRDGILFAEPWLFPELREVLPASLLGVEAGGSAGAAGSPASSAAAAAPDTGPLHALVPEGMVTGGVPFRLYYLAAATGATGALTLRAADGAAFELFFRKGGPELARSAAPGLDLGSFLVGKGVLDARGLARAEAARGAHGGDLLHAIFAQGLLAPNQAFPLLAEHARAVLDRALALEAGTFRWDPSATPPPAAFPLGGKWELLCGAGRRLDPATVRRRLGSRVDRPVMQAGDGLARLDDLRLTAQERRIVASFDGTRSLAELVAANPAEAEPILRTACFLADLGLASFAAPSPGEKAASPRRDGAGRPAAEVRPPPPPPAAPAAPRRPAIPTPVVTPSVTVRPIPGGAAVPIQPPVLRPVAAPAAPSASTANGAAPARAPVAPASVPAAGVSAPPRPPAAPASVPAASGAASARAPASPPFASASAPPRAPAAPAPAPAAIAGEQGLPSDLAGVRAVLEGFAGKDHFAVLGLTRAATTAQIKAAYFRLARAFHPDTAGAGADPELRRAKQDLTARLNEAYQVLSDEGRRSEYLQALAAGVSSPQVDVAALLAAEERFSWAVLRVKARKFAEGLEALEKAIELNPAEGEFYAWRAWARFAPAPDPKAAAPAALSDVQKALELSPKCAVAWLFAARIWAAAGHHGRAADAYRKCLALDAGQIEAQRELRLLEGRGTTR